MENNQFGNYLKSLRLSQRMTIRKLEELSGVSNSYISQIEKGVSMPSPEILKKLYKPLGVSFSEMMVKAGHMQYEDLDDYLIGQEPELDDESRKIILEENREKRIEMQEKLKKSEELRLKNELTLKELQRDLHWVVNRLDSTYKNMPLTDNDRYDIIKYLEFLFHDRMKPESKE